MASVLGLEAKLYIDDQASYASPTWAEVSNVKDLTLTLEKNLADVSTRGSGGWRANRAVLKDATIGFKMIWDTSDVNFQIIRDAFLDNEFVNVAAMDGDIETPGSEGLRAMCEVSKFTRNEPLEEALDVDVELKPAFFPSDPPEWLSVT